MQHLAQNVFINFGVGIKLVFRKYVTYKRLNGPIIINKT